MNGQAKIRLDLLEELMMLRARGDKEAFMNGLYKAILDSSTDDEVQAIQWQHEGIMEMIRYFSIREEYEKCAALLKLVNEEI